MTAEHKLLVYGAGTMIGFAAVQMALMRRVRVIATAGEAFAAQLHALGAAVTPYGEGMVERVLDICGGVPDRILDAGPISGVLPDLVWIAGGDPRRGGAICAAARRSALGRTLWSGSAHCGHHKIVDIPGCGRTKAMATRVVGPAAAILTGSS